MTMLNLVKHKQKHCNISYVENYARFYDLLLHGEDIYLCVHCDWQMLHTSSPHCSITITWQASGVWRQAKHRICVLRIASMRSGQQRQSLRHPPRQNTHCGGHYLLELQTNFREDYGKFYNQREGPYQSLLLVGSTYQRFHIQEDTMQNGQ